MHALPLRIVIGLVFGLLLITSSGCGKKGAPPAGSTPTSNTPITDPIAGSQPDTTSPAEGRNTTTTPPATTGSPVPASVYLATALQAKTTVVLIDAEAAKAKSVTPTDKAWQNFELVPFGNYSATAITDMHFRSAMFTLEGKIFAVSLLKTDSATSRQISNETGATNLCNRLVNQDFFNHSNTGFLYELAGADNDCTNAMDNQWKVVRLSMTATDSPIAIVRPILALDDIVTGAAGTGWLAQSGNDLSLYDASFTKIQLISSGNTFSNLSAARDFVIIDNKLYYYSQAGKTLSRVLHDFGLNAVGRMNLSDGTFDFFYEKTPTETKIFKIRSDGSQASEFLTTETGSLLEYALTLNHLFYTVSSGSAFALKSITHAAPFTVATIPLSVSGLPVNLATHGSKIYYNIEPNSANNDTYLACILDENGSEIVTANARWVGLNWAKTVTHTTAIDVVNKFVRLDGYDPTARKFINGTLRSYNAVDGTFIANLGTMPTNVSHLSFNPEFGDRTVGFAYNNGLVDIYLIQDLATPNSLVRLTGAIP